MSISLMPATGVSRTDAAQIASLFARLVADGAALGWVDPPGEDEITELLAELAVSVSADEAQVAIARVTVGGAGSRIVGIAYWTRYTRSTHRPHVDVEKVAVDPQEQGSGVGRQLMRALIARARELQMEVMTLDLRADNAHAIALYEAVGFERYGLLPDFVAVGPLRFDTHLYALDLRR